MTKKKRVLELFEFEPPPGQRGGSAGNRVEGREWATEMREFLTTDGFVVETAIAKSTGGEHIDGNASERVSYKMLRFKRSPLARGRTLVVALNCAFVREPAPGTRKRRNAANAGKAAACAMRSDRSRPQRRPASGERHQASAESAKLHGMAASGRRIASPQEAGVERAVV